MLPYLWVIATAPRTLNIHLIIQIPQSFSQSPLDLLPIQKPKAQARHEKALQHLVDWLVLMSCKYSWYYPGTYIRTPGEFVQIADSWVPPNTYWTAICGGEAQQLVCYQASSTRVVHSKSWGLLVWVLHWRFAKMRRNRVLHSFDLINDFETCSEPSLKQILHWDFKAQNKSEQSCIKPLARKPKLGG